MATDPTPEEEQQLLSIYTGETVPEPEADTPETPHIFLPEPEGYKCAEIHFSIHPPIQWDMSHADAVSAFEHARAHGTDLLITDPKFGEPFWLPNDSLKDILYIGVAWIPHEQLQAQAVRRRFEEAAAKRKRNGR